MTGVRDGEVGVVDDGAPTPAAAPPRPPRSRAESSAGAWAVCVLLAVAALLNVAPVLGWVSGLGSFSSWFVRLSLPALLVVVGIAIWSWRASGPVAERAHRAVVLGTLGGILGTLGYDLVRIPFVVLGLRVLAPIESYGVLLLDAHASTSLTAFAGWGYHFANGICFGIAYAAILPRAKIRWAVLWALTLETATIVTPFASAYNLAGHTDLIALAYGAHVPYGLGLGWVVRNGDEVLERLAAVRAPAALAVGALAVALAVWLQPAPPYRADAAVHVRNGRFDHAWVRVPPGGCVTMTNDDAAAFTVTAADGAPSVAPGQTAPVCFSNAAIYRVKPVDVPYAGGFVLVDPELDPSTSVDTAAALPAGATS